MLPSNMATITSHATTSGGRLKVNGFRFTLQSSLTTRHGVWCYCNAGLKNNECKLESYHSGPNAVVRSLLNTGPWPTSQPVATLSFFAKAA